MDPHQKGYTVRLSRRDGEWQGVLLDDCLNAVRFESAAELWELLNVPERAFTAEVEHLRRAVVTDYLTGVLNRRGVEQLALDGEPWRYTSVFFLDIDNFKAINDTRGHDYGDEVLRQVANAIRSCVRHVDVVGRVGGDEFVILFQELEDAVLLRRKAEEIRAAVLGLGAEVSISIGGACGRGMDYEGLVHLADRALYQVKSGGKNGFVLCSPRCHERP